VQRRRVVERKKKNEMKRSEELKVKISKGDGRGKGGKRGEREANKDDGMSQEEARSVEKKVAGRE